MVLQKINDELSKNYELCTDIKQVSALCTPHTTWYLKNYCRKDVKPELCQFLFLLFTNFEISSK